MPRNANRSSATLRFVAILALFTLLGCGHRDRSAQVIAAENDLARAFNTGDAALLERITAPDFMGVDTDGTRYDRAQNARIAQEFFRSGQHYSTSGLRVEMYGDTAVAQGYDHVRKPDGTPGHGTSWTDTWVLREGRWLIVSAADIPIAQ